METGGDLKKEAETRPREWIRQHAAPFVPDTPNDPQQGQRVAFGHVDRLSAVDRVDKFQNGANSRVIHRING
jgi:hypothetical protein